MTESPCQGCKHLQKSWRKGNASIIKWVCGRFKLLAEKRCIDFVERGA